MIAAMNNLQAQVKAAARHAAAVAREPIGKAVGKLRRLELRPLGLGATDRALANAFHKWS